MGRRIRVRTNSRLASEHPAGSRVVVLQPLIHDRHGAMVYPFQRLWRFHYRAAQVGASSLQRLQDEILDVEIDTSNFRRIDDSATLFKVYYFGNLLVSNAVRAIQHLSEEIERHAGITLTGQTSTERIREAFVIACSADITQEPGYAGVGEIVQIKTQ